MSNFCHDTELDPSLFSLEPPAGYKVDRMEAKMPVEEDLLSTLRLIAEHNDGTFPSTIGMPSEESLKALEVASKAETEKRMKEPEIVKLREDLQAQYGKDNDGFMKAWTKAMKPFNQKLTEKYVEGMRFYNLLNSENDSRYAGKGVKLDTPDRAIFWYKPTGAEKYRVIYADLTVKEMDADAVKEMPEAEAK
jgi:hypothetical protein